MASKTSRKAWARILTVFPSLYRIRLLTALWRVLRACPRLSPDDGPGTPRGQAHSPTKASAGAQLLVQLDGPFSDQVNMDTCTNNFDTVLAVYTGGSVGGLSQFASNDDACAPGSQLTFNATGVSRTANVTATFSEAMNEASVEAPGVVTLKKSSGGAAVAATVTYNPTTKKVTLNPNVSRVRNTLYSAKGTTGARDLAGNPLDQNATTAGNQAKTWKFTTVQ